MPGTTVEIVDDLVESIARIHPLAEVLGEEAVGMTYFASFP